MIFLGIYHDYNLPKVILSILKKLKAAHFEENVNDGILGNLVYQDKTFNVKLYRDSVCQYICLEFPLHGVKNIKNQLMNV